MSMPDATLYCDKCDLSGIFHGPSKNCYYLDGDLEIPMSWSTGYCHECESIGAIREYLPSAKRIEENIAFEEKQIGGFDRWHMRVLLVISRKAKSNLAALNRARRTLVRQLDLREQRLGKEVCYNCGASGIAEFTGKLNLELSDNFCFIGDAATGFIHPGCGGEIRAKGTGMRFMYILGEPEYFSIDGSRITARDTQ